MRKVLVAGLGLVLSGCGGSDTFISFGGKAGGQPVFCVSEKPNCADPGGSLRALQVDQVDEDGREVAVMWRIEGPGGWGSAYTLDKITYGAAPVGWTIKAPARQLVAGEHYRVNNEFYFSVTSNGLVLAESRP